MTYRYIFGIFILLWSIIAAQDVPPSEAYAAFLRDALGVEPAPITLIPEELVGETYIWKNSTGEDWTWNGGPDKSSNGSAFAEYWVFDTSEFILQTESEDLEKVATLAADQQNPTSMSGNCLTFWYNTKGSIIKSFDMVIANIFEDVHVRKEVGGANSTDTEPTEFTRSRILWSAPENTNGEWMPMSQTYVSPYNHHIGWSTVPKATGTLNKQRGYTAIENIEVWPKPCPGDCLFIKDACSWTVEADGPAIWTIGRSISQLKSGPQLDYPSSKDMRREAGYLYLDTSYPAKTEDSSRIVSIQLIPPQIPNVPYCLRFKALFYGAQEMGFLRVILQTETSGGGGNSTTSTFEDKQILWSYGGKISSPSFSRLSWINIEVPVVWNEENIKVGIEGTVGRPGRSNIAIDSLRLNQMSCMLLPEVGLADVPLILDCSFGAGTCEWTPSGMWRRVVGTGLQDDPFGHTDIARTLYGGDSYISANLADTTYAAGSWSTMASTKFQPVDRDFCVSFWYYMFSKGTMYPTLGGIRVYLQEKLDSATTSLLLWSLDNHQGDTWLQAFASFRSSALEVTLKFVVVKGTGRSASETLAIDDISVYPRLCTAFPELAKADILDCDFYRDMCGWNVINPDGLEEERFNFRLANSQNHLQFVNGHTFRTPNKGYVFIDSANNGITSHLLISDNKDVDVANGTSSVNCLSFWFRTHNFQADASLSVAWNIAVDPTNTIVWRYPPRDGQVDSSKDLSWTYAQVEIPVKVGEGKKVRIMARVRTSAIAIDDIKHERNSKHCPTRPESAAYNGP